MAAEPPRRPETVLASVERNSQPLRYCLQRNPTATKDDQFRATVMLNADGDVESVDVDAPTPEVEACVEKKLRRVLYPKKKVGFTVSIKHDVKATDSLQVDVKD